MAANPKTASERQENAWRDFAPGSWQTRVNLRDFIQRNYTPVSYTHLTLPTILRV